MPGMRSEGRSKDRAEKAEKEVRRARIKIASESHSSSIRNSMRQSQSDRGR